MRPTHPDQTRTLSKPTSSTSLLLSKPVITSTPSILKDRCSHIARKIARFRKPLLSPNRANTHPHRHRLLTTRLPCHAYASQFKLVHVARTVAEEGCRLSHMGVCQENILFSSVGVVENGCRTNQHLQHDLVRYATPQARGSATAQTSFVQQIGTMTQFPFPDFHNQPDSRLQGTWRRGTTYRRQGWQRYPSSLLDNACSMRR